MHFKNSRLLLFFSIIFLLFSYISVGTISLSTSLPVDAQFDSDNDGVPNEIDECPETPGSGEFGCPVDTDGDGVNDTNDVCPETPGEGELGCPDADGDGLTTRQDRCPVQPGPRSNAGCPTEEPAEPSTDTPQPATDPPPLPVLPDDGACMLATDGRFDVNVRAEPTDNAEIIDVIDPFQIYSVQQQSEDDTWYQLASNDGWVAASVTRTAGDCQFAAETDETGLLNCPTVSDVTALPVYVQNALADNDNPCEDAADILQESVFGQPGIRHLPDETGDRMENNCPALLDDANLRLARLRQYDQALYDQTVGRISSADNPCEATQAIPNTPEIGAVWCMPHFDDTDIVHLTERTQGYIEDFGGEVSSCGDIYQVRGIGDMTPAQREFAGALLPACDLQSYTRVLELVSTAMSVNADFEDVLGDNRICIGLDPAQVILDYQQPAPPAAAPSLPPAFIGCPMLGKQIRNHSGDLTPISLLSLVKSRNPCDAGREYLRTGRLPALPAGISSSLNECLPPQGRERVGELLSADARQRISNTVTPAQFPESGAVEMANLTDDAASPIYWLANANTPWDVKLAMIPTGNDDPCDTGINAPQPADFVCAHFISKQYQNLSSEDPISVEARLVYYGLNNSGNRQIAGAASQWTSIVLPPTGSGGVAFGTQTPDRRPQYDFMVQTRVLTLGGQPVAAGDYQTTGQHQIIVGRSAQCDDNTPSPDSNLSQTGQICVRYRGHFANYGELTAPARVTLGYEGQPRNIHIHETPTQEVYIPANGYGATMIFTVQIPERPNRSVQAFYHMYPGDNVQNISERIETVPISNCDDDFTPLPDEGAPAATESATEEATTQVLSATVEPTATPQIGRPPRAEREYCLVFTEMLVNYVEEDKGTQTFRVRVFYEGNLKHEVSDDITHEAGFNPAAGASFRIPSYAVTVVAESRSAIFSNLAYKYRLHIQRDSIFKSNGTLKGEVLNIATSAPLALTRTGGQIRVFSRNDENAPDGCEWQTPATSEPDDDDRDQGILDCGRSDPFGLLDERGDVHEYSYKASVGETLNVHLRTEATSPIIPSLTGLNLIGPNGSDLGERTLDNRVNLNQSRRLEHTVQTDGWYTIRISVLGGFESYTEPDVNTKWNYIFTFNCETSALQGQSGMLSNVGGVNGLPQLDVSGISNLRNQLDNINGIRTRCVAFYSEVNNNSSSDTRAEVQLVAEDASGNTTIVSQPHSRTIPAGETRALNFEETVIYFASDQLRAQFSGQGIRYNQWLLTFQGSGSDCNDNQLPGQGNQSGQSGQTNQQTQTGQPAGGASPASQPNLSSQAIPSAGDPTSEADTAQQSGQQRVSPNMDFFSGNLAAVGVDADGVLYGLSNGVAEPFFDEQPHERIAAPALSPNGSRLAYTGIDGETQRLYVMNIDRDIEVAVDIGDLSLTDDQPVWSADSERLLVALQTSDEQTNIYRLTSDDAFAITEPLVENATQPALSSNGSYLLFTRDDNIFSRSADSGRVVQVTDDDMQCESPVVDSNQITAYVVCGQTLYRHSVSGVESLDVTEPLVGIRAGSETGRLALYDSQDTITMYDARQAQTYPLNLDISLTMIDWR